MYTLSKDEIKNVFENLSEGIIVHNNDTSISYFNQSALDILKISSDELLGKTAHDPRWFFINEEHEKLELNEYPVMKILNNKKTLNNMIMGINHSDDSIIWVQVSGVPIFDKEKNIDIMIISFMDITKQKETLEQLNDKTYFNQTTHLPNSLSLNESLKNIPEKSALVVLEIDSFSNLTQYFGHGATTKLLCFVAKTLENKIKKPNMVFHTKQNEFAILLQDELANKNSIHSLLILLNERDLFFEEFGLNLQITAGISFEKNDIEISAQAALNNAKSDKDSFFKFYSKTNKVNISLNNEIFWSQALRQVIEKNTLIPVFQQIINNDTMEIDKYEVLMRLKVDDEIYSPFAFLDISKKLKLYKYLTISLIENVFHYFKDKNIPFSINLNTEDLMSDDINFILLRKVQAFHTPSNITIEVVESEGIENFKEVNRFLNRLKLYGCKVAIDDFGSGYSNFEYILKLDADYIKIDGSLIKDIDVNQDSQDIVRTIVSFAKKKNIKTIAEFVSSKEIYAMIKSIGIDYSQGYYFGKPEFDVENIQSITIDETKVIKDERKKYKQLIYASKQNIEFNVDVLKQSFKEASLRNEQHGITGFIVFDGEYFLQIIEGDDTKVNQLYENIVKDKKHTNIQLIGTNMIEARRFENWNLGYVDEEKVIQDFVHKRTNKKRFLPHQFDYKFALEFLADIQKIV